MYDYQWELIKERQVIPPEGGWEPRSLYLVEVSWNSQNPVYPALFYSGFLIDGQPAQYNVVWNPTDEDRRSPISEVHFLRVVKKLDVDLHPPWPSGNTAEET